MFEVSKDKSLVNVANSILKHFDIKTFHTTYEKLDEVRREIEDRFGKMKY